MPVDKAAQLAGTNPDYSIQDLYEAIATGNFVSEIIHFINISLSNSHHGLSQFK